MKQLYIHFVCTGNAYRSRLAEAYLRSKKLPNVNVSSSGIQAKEFYHKNGPISWYAARLIKRHDLIPHTKRDSTQTSLKHLNNADIVVFMTDMHYTYAKTKLKYHKNTFEIWNIGDIDDADFFGTERDSDMMRIQHSEKTFKQIKEKVDSLVKRLKHE
jgi:protein-tyrosine-phosphatase